MVAVQSGVRVMEMMKSKIPFRAVVNVPELAKLVTKADMAAAISDMMVAMALNNGAVNATVGVEGAPT